jgi:hypothetical protein
LRDKIDPSPLFFDLTLFPYPPTLQGWIPLFNTSIKWEIGGEASIGRGKIRELKRGGASFGRGGWEEGRLGGGRDYLIY